MQVGNDSLKHVHIIPDEQLQFYAGAYVYDITKQTSYTDHVVYTPHSGENFGNVGFLKLKLLCKKKGIRLSAFGHLNQFSEMGILADTVIAQPDDRLLSRLYRHQISHCHIDRKIIPQVTSARFIQGHHMSGSSHNFLLSRGNCAPLLGEQVTPELRERHALVIEAMDTIDDQEVIDSFVWPDIYIRQSTWELFHQLDLPKDVICCEAKLGGAFSGKVREWLRKSGLPKATGFEQIFQQKLLRKVGAHYMGIQFLASWLNNWMFVCVGGSANLFAIMPVKGIVMYDYWYHNTSTVPCLRGLAQRRYGSLGNEIPVFLTHRAITPVEKYLDSKKDLLMQSIERLSTCHYGGGSE